MAPPRGGKRGKEGGGRSASSAKRARAAPPPPPPPLAAAEPLVVVADPRQPTLDARAGELTRLSAAAAEGWAARAAAREASLRGPAGDLLRLLGTLELELSGEAARALRGARPAGSRAAPLRRAAPKWGKGAQPEWWSESTGEPSRVRSLSVSRLLDGRALDGAACAAARELLSAVRALAAPSPALWGTPLAVALASYTAHGGGGAERGTLRLGVYAARLYFETNGGQLSKRVLDALAAAHPAARPLARLPAHAPCYTTAGGGEGAAAFTLEHLLASAEHAGYREAAPPPGLALRLLPYQRQSLAWLQDMESPAILPMGLNSLFWEEKAFADGGSWYYMPSLGEARLDTPPLLWGGLLCEEMGLGKSLELIALVLSSRGNGPTLIVAPEPLLGQWEAEIDKCVHDWVGLRVRTVCAAEAALSAARAPTPAQLEGADIVLCSYAELETCRALQGARWHRVCLDEMQMLRSPTTRVAKVAERLHCARRWMISGTPLYAGLDDLRGELNFLHVSPFGAAHEDGFWAHCVRGPWDARDGSALGALQLLLSTLMMRHSKAQRTLADGRALLELPPQRVTYARVALSAPERAVYAYAEAAVADVARARLRAGGALGGAGWAGARAHANPFAPGGAAVAAGAAVDAGLRLLRELADTPSALAGGAGLPPQLGLLDGIERARAHHSTADFASALEDGGLGAAARAGVGSPLDAVRALRPDAVIRELTRGTDLNDSVAHRRMAGGTGLVRYGGQATAGVHERARARAGISDVAAELARCARRREVLGARRAEAAGACARGRWRWAVEALTCSPLEYRCWTDGARADAAALREVGATQRAAFWWRVWRLRSRLLAAIDGARSLAQAELDEGGDLQAHDDGGAGEEEGGARGREVHGLFGGGALILTVTPEHGAGGKAAAAGAGAARAGGGGAAAARPGAAAGSAAGAGARAGAMGGSGGGRPARKAAAKAASKARLVARAEEADADADAEDAGAGPTAARAADAALAAEEGDGAPSEDEPPGLVVSATLRMPMWSARGVWAGAPHDGAPNHADGGGARPAARPHLLAPAGWRPPPARGGAGRGARGAWDAASSRSALEHVCSAACAGVHAGEHAREVLSRAHAARAEAARAAHDSASVEAMESKLHAASRHQLSLGQVEQRGFSELLALCRGEALSATCPICFDAVGSCGNPVLLRHCAHLACKGCLAAHVAYTRAARGLDGGARMSGDVEADAKCALCRRAFTVAELIEVLPAAEGDGHEGGGADAPAADAPAGAPPPAERAGAADSAPPPPSAPAYSPAATRDEYAALSAGPALGEARQLPETPLLPPRLLSQLRAATGHAPPGSAARTPVCRAHLSSKLRALLADVRGLAACGEKAVVFSAHRGVVEHVSRVLDAEGIGHRTLLAQSGRRAEHARAVREWREDCSVPCFVLHAGVAAAGLTLVAAHHVFVLDVFTHSAEELQALNRCHRIGQGHAVSCTVYYAERTVEERLLAYRAREAEEGTDAAGAHALSVLAGSVPAGARGAPSLSQAKMAFVLGVAPDDAAAGAPAAAGPAADERPAGGAAVQPPRHDEA